MKTETRILKSETKGRRLAARRVLECGSPLPLSHPPAGRATSQSARGLAQSKTWRSFVAALAFVATATIAHAQSYSIDWFTIDGGGGTSTGAPGLPWET